MRFVVKDVHGDLHRGTEDLESDEELTEAMEDLAIKLFDGQLAYLSLAVNGKIKYFNPKNIVWFGLE
jgi:hypothetical protein